MLAEYAKKVKPGGKSCHWVGQWLSNQGLVPFHLVRSLKLWLTKVMFLLIKQPENLSLGRPDGGEKW